MRVFNLVPPCKSVLRLFNASTLVTNRPNRTKCWFDMRWLSNHTGLFISVDGVAIVDCMFGSKP